MIPRLLPAIKISELALGLAARGSVPAFECAFARLAKTKHAIAFPYGRTALMCLLEALGLKGRNIICPSYTCVVVPHAITYAGNTPVFVDCAKDSYLMDLELASQAADESTGALVATSFFGEPVSLDAISAFSARHPNVAIIQDCAHSFFCEDAGRAVHKHSIATIYGLNISKIITSVFGGMITTDNDVLAANLRKVRQARLLPATLGKSIQRRLYFVTSRLSLSPPVYGSVKWLSSFGVLDRFIRYYNDAVIDMPRDYLMQLTDFEAAIGLHQCMLYDTIVAHRRGLADYYHAELYECTHLRLPAPRPGHTWSHYTVGVDKAEKYVAAAAKQGIELGQMLEYFIPDMQVYAHHRHLDRSVARNYIGKTVNLPLHAGVTLSTADRIVDLMRENI